MSCDPSRVLDVFWATPPPWSPIASTVGPVMAQFSSRMVPVVVATLVIAACGSETSSSPTTAESVTTPAAVTEVETTVAATTAPVEAPTTVASTSAPVVPDEVPTLEWTELIDGTESAYLTVPADYSDPDGDTIELKIVRHRATDPANRIGSLLVNFGGPGFGSADSVSYMPFYFDPLLGERFDLIGWDPRGTGMSRPAIDCIDDFDPYVAELDHTPDDETERQAVIDSAKDFADRCVERNGDLIGVVGTNNSARDMDMIRRALGEDKISYLGFSYGSELGATWATLFPDTVRAAVLDGAADPTADDFEWGLQQIGGFAQSVDTFLSQCSADPECAFYHNGHASMAFDRLMTSLDKNPVPSVAGRPPVNRDVAISAVIQAMYSDSMWPTLAEGLATAEAGDGSILLSLYDEYYGRFEDGTYGNELEAFQVISCADSAERLSIEESDAQGPFFTEAAPRLVPEGTIEYFCEFFPKAADPRIDITGAGAGPIVVIGTTGDSATPLESTRTMAETLEDGRLVIVEANQHTGYGTNFCVDGVVNDYLVELVAPADETTCS